MISPSAIVCLVPAIDLASVLQKDGEQKYANQLLNHVHEIRRKIPRLGWTGYWIDDDRIYVIRGETQSALKALREAVNEGWRVFWCYHLEYDLVLESLHNEAEYQLVLEEIRADMANQLARVKEMDLKEGICAQ